MNYNQGEVLLYCDSFHVRRGWRRSIAFKTSPKNYDGDTYRGYLFKEKNFYVALSSASSDDEYICNRFKRRSIGKDSFFVSISLAHDYDGNASANPSILTKSELTLEEFTAIISENIRIFQKERIMKIA